MRALRVTAPFASFVRGQTISDPALVEKYLASRRKFVVPVTLPDLAPKPKASAKTPTATSDAA